MSPVRWNTALAVVEAFVSAAVLFILYGVILAALGPDRFGSWSVLTAATGAAAMADLGVGRAIARFVAVAEAQAAGSGARYVATGFIITCTASAVVALMAWWPVAALLQATLPADRLLEVAPLLPLTLVAFWLGSTASAGAATADGLHRSRLRSLAGVSANVIYLAAAVLLVDSSGMFGLAVALVLREAARLSALLVIVLRLVPFRVLREEPWRWATCREMLAYSLRLQSTAVFVFLVEPASRLLLARFGSLEMVAFYEMAWRLVQQVRNLIVAANQVLIPAFAAATLSGGDRLFSIYRRASDLTFLASILFLGLVLIAAPVISVVWLGAQQPIFENTLRIVALGWLVNLFAVTAHFLAAGSGKLRGVLASHAAQGISNLAFGWLLGSLFGGWGVVAATAVSLCTGAIIVFLDTHLALVGRRSPVSRAVMLTAGLTTAGLAVLGWIMEALHDAPLPSQLFALAVGSVALGLLVLLRHRREFGLDGLLPPSRKAVHA